MKSVLALMATGLLGLHAAPAAAQADQAECGVKRIVEEGRITIPAHIQVSTRLILPDRIETHTNSASALWNVETTQRKSKFLFVRPNSLQPVDDRTGVTVVTEDGRHYDFVFEAAADVPDVTCWKVLDGRDPELPATLRRRDRSG